MYLILNKQKKSWTQNEVLAFDNVFEVHVHCIFLTDSIRQFLASCCPNSSFKSPTAFLRETCTDSENTIISDSSTTWTGKHGRCSHVTQPQLMWVQLRWRVEKNIYATGFLHNSNLKKAGRLNMYSNHIFSFFITCFICILKWNKRWQKSSLLYYW